MTVINVKNSVYVVIVDVGGLESGGGEEDDHHDDDIDRAVMDDPCITHTTVVMTTHGQTSSES